MFLLLPLSTFSTQQDNPKCGPFKCHQVCKAQKALPVNIKQNHCRFHGITFPHHKEKWEERKGSFRVGVWMRTLCECEWKLYILCYFNRLCLFSLKEIVWEKIGLSSFYFISMHLCSFTKINLLSHVINSCFTIVVVHIILLQVSVKQGIRAGKQNICFFGEWSIYHYLQLVCQI